MRHSRHFHPERIAPQMRRPVNLAALQHWWPRALAADRHKAPLQPVHIAGSPGHS